MVTAASSKMAEKTLSEVYEAVCLENEIKVVPDVLGVFREATESGKWTLKLAGNRLKCGERLDDADALALTKCLKHNKHVTGLDLSYNSIGDEGAGLLANLLQDNDSGLLSLDLTLNDLEMGGAKVLAASLQTNSRLLALALSGNKIGSGGAMTVAAMLQVNNTLQELHLASCDLDTQSVIALSEALKTNQSVRCLDVTRPLLFSLQEEWAVHVAQMLEVNSSLLELHLGMVELSDGGVEVLAGGLRRNHSLRYLDLRCNRVSCFGVRHLADLLKNNGSLEIIDLSSNRIDDEGAEYLSDVLTGSDCSLKELSVCRNKMGTEGLLSLCEALKTNRTLTHLFFWGNLLEEPVCQVVSELMSSGRLLPEHTDVSPYLVDGRVFLAQGPHCLRKHLHRSLLYWSHLKYLSF